MKLVLLLPVMLALSACKDKVTLAREAGAVPIKIQSECIGTDKVFATHGAITVISMHHECLKIYHNR